MKFRGKMVELCAIKKFYTFIGTMAKIAKTCVLRLTQDKFYFILTEAESVVSRPQVWCEMNQENYFNEYNIEGVSAEHDEIYLEFSPDSLAKTLTSLKLNTNAKSLKIKLTKKYDEPSLTFEVELESLSTTSFARQCVHDISVKVIPWRSWSEYEEPSMREFDVSLCLPDLKKLRHILDRYRTLGQAVSLTASRAGRLSLEVTSNEGVFSTHFSDLRVPVTRDNQELPLQRNNSSQEEPGNGAASVRVELKRLCLFLAGEQLGPRRSIANIVDQEMLHMFLIHDDFIVQYFLHATSKP